jgi:proteasome assembly chaperone (PAC2) family protein
MPQEEPRADRADQGNQQGQWGQQDQGRYLEWSTRPTLRNPILIAAFEGWNDAAEAATSALTFVRDTWRARRFATIDPEEFYDFTETRPMVKLVRGVQRRIDWPANEFYYHADPARGRDFVLLAAVEPQLKWRTFTRLVLGVAQDLRVTTIVTLGALLADVPHGRPARVSVTATDDTLRKRLGEQGARGSRYEGPTGIVGVLQDACGRAGIPGASLWGHAPHYLSASPNPQVQLGILRRLDGLLDLDLDLRELEDEAETFIAQVNEAVSHDPEATSYVRQLEAQDDEEDDEDEEDGESFRRPRGPAGASGSGGGLIQDVEDFLRRRRASED